MSDDVDKVEDASVDSGAQTAAETPVAEESSEAEAVAAKEEPVSSTAATRPRQSAGLGSPLAQRLAYADRPVWYRVGQWLLPPLLVAAAVGVHWKLNVPDKLLESPRDQGSKAKKKAKKKKSKRKMRDKPRTDEQFDADWERYRAEPFAKEPVRSSWARRHQALINRAVVVARREGFDGAPEKPNVVLADTQCHSVRCEFVLRSPFSHELDVIGKTFDRLEIDGEPLFRSLDIEPTEAPEGEPSHEFYSKVTVGFWRDRTDTRRLGVSGGEGDEADDEGTADADADAAGADKGDKANTPVVPEPDAPTPRPEQ